MHNLHISGEGEITSIYSDDLVNLINQGEASVTRASHVEPGRDSEGLPCWWADMGPSGGGILGPFYTRTEALQKEVEWLNEKIFDSES